jgi:hypothetical protein
MVRELPHTVALILQRRGVRISARCSPSSTHAPPLSCRGGSGPRRHEATRLSVNRSRLPPMPQPRSRRALRPRSCQQPGWSGTGMKMRSVGLISIAAISNRQSLSPSVVAGGWRCLHLTRTSLSPRSRGDTVDGRLRPYAAAYLLNTRLVRPCVSTSDHGHNENRHSRSPQ